MGNRKRSKPQTSTKLTQGSSTGTNNALSMVCSTCNAVFTRLSILMEHVGKRSCAGTGTGTGQTGTKQKKIKNPAKN